MREDRGEGRSAADWLALARVAERSGDFIGTYDVSMRGLREHPEGLGLKHRAVLALARSGALDQACIDFDRLGLGEVCLRVGRMGEEVAALEARIAKDRALLLPEDVRRGEAVRARDLYLAIHEHTKDYYPGINAATLSLIAGERERAVELARRVLEICSAERGREGESYYLAATEAEAALLLGDTALATTKLEQAASLSRGDHAALATTRKQLRRICAALGTPVDILDPLRPPRVIHYTGHLIQQPGRAGRFWADAEDRVKGEIEEHLAARGVGYGFGSLACGADILVVEALLARGAEVHVVLPFREEEFIETSVRCAGSDWVARFRDCLAGATAVSFASTDRFCDEDRLFGYATRLATGLALLRARNLDTDVEQLAIWDGEEATGTAGTGADVRLWREKGHRATVIEPGDGFRSDAQTVSPAEPTRASTVRGDVPTREVRAMLFGDVKGFSGLAEGQIPAFVDQVMGCFARVLDRYGESVLFENTWGDGLYVVFAEEQSAAQCALDLQAAMAALDLAKCGLPEELAFRVGLHVGPVFEVHDHVLDCRSFCGENVTRTARIEPVTPPGEVFVTEQMAAALALVDPEQACEYVGQVPSAKGYGDMRMYVLKRRS